MVCLDSLLTQEERNSITEIFWACRFGRDIEPLISNNPYYPNVIKHHYIDDEVGMNAMAGLDPVAMPFWHFRPDFHENKAVGLRLFNESGHDMHFIDAAKIIYFSDIPFIESTFLLNATIKELPASAPTNYILFHYPTSTRPRSDIAEINRDDWAFISNLSKETGYSVIIISDHNIEPPLENHTLLVKPSIRSVIALAKFASFYAGCDSFVAGACCKSLEADRLFIKSHNPNITSHILSRGIRHFLPHDSITVSKFYKSYIG